MNSSPIRYQSKVLALESCSSSCYRLFVDRCDMPFQAGHEIMVHGAEPFEDRQYSVASGTDENHLEIFFRLIPDGVLTPKLAQLTAGDPIEFTGPFGSFLIRDPAKPLVFIATGTGIAPAMSFLSSDPALDIEIFHGVRLAEDLVSLDGLAKEKYHACISQEMNSEHYQGRVTQKLNEIELNRGADYYLCGANEMILEVHRSLKERGVPEEHIYSEAYYFW